ncbi:hypothetical protein [Rothia terrae]|uniref:Uncharacterized protein n=1 Tax=Rothia terrae TaxID=396015 RepID=A0A7H2BBT8_9MICC|nr:hypothetical protein [Rothia terrae]QNV37134.1 hypothetical protein IDM49_07695 [Rothia terrae]
MPCETHLSQFKDELCQSINPLSDFLQRHLLGVVVLALILMTIIGKEERKLLAVSRSHQP